MADDLDNLLSAQAGEISGDDVDALLTAHASGNAEPAPKAAAGAKASLPWYERAAFGAADPIVGAGQLMQNSLPDRVMNVARKSFQSIVDPFVSKDTSQSIGEPRSTEDINAMVREREGGYQQQRADAGQKGLDWWRVGGNVANPVTWLAPEGSGAGVVSALATGAKQGAFQALMQPVNSTGSFLYDKGMQALVGSATGATLAGSLEALRPAFGQAHKALGKAFGKADEAAQLSGAEKVVDDTLKTAGVDPTKVDPNLYSAMRREVKEALAAGVEPDPAIMTRRADASALPVPIDLTRGQASRDPFQYSWEKNQGSKIAGVGEPLSQRLQAQNRQLIENLNVLGAKNAPSTFDASQAVISHFEGIDAQAKAAINQAYSAVRDSAGRPALMDQAAFQETARNALEHGQLTEFVPETIKKQYNAISTGQVPLTVDTAQTLDKVWSAAQRSTQDGPTKMAIGHLRDALNNAPVKDQLGEQSMQAYKAARAMAKQRFDALDANPAYKAAVDGVEPDKFWQKYVQGANVSELSSLKKMVGPDNTAVLQKTFLGNLKKAALSRASDEDGSFSQAALNKVLHDDVQAPRIRELFAGNDETLSQLYRLGRVAEDIKRFPEGHSVNTSNTAVTAANIIGDTLKSEGGGALVSMIPGGKLVKHVSDQVRDKAASSQAVNEALTPGVTRGALKKAAPSTQMRKLGELISRGGAAYAVSNEDE